MRRIQDMDAIEGMRQEQRATVTVDRDGIIREWDDAVTDVAGYSADEAVGSISRSSSRLCCAVSTGAGSTRRCNGVG